MMSRGLVFRRLVSWFEMFFLGRRSEKWWACWNTKVSFSKQANLLLRAIDKVKERGENTELHVNPHGYLILRFMDRDDYFDSELEDTRKTGEIRRFRGLGVHVDKSGIEGGHIFLC